MALELNDRDLAVLLFTWQSRFVSTGQLRRAFWQGAARTAGSRRLNTLRQAGLLGFALFPWLPERVLYFACRKGNRVLADCGLLPREWLGDHPQRPEEQSPTLRHDLKVVDLRLGLEESGADGRTWVSDHQLRMEPRWEGPRDRVPDGIFAYRHAGTRGRGVLEYEHAPYRRALVSAVLARLRRRHGERRLFIVTKTAERAATFRAWAWACGVYNDAPKQALFAHHAAVAEQGLDGGFVDLEGRAWNGR